MQAGLGVCYSCYIRQIFTWCATNVDYSEIYSKSFANPAGEQFNLGKKIYAFMS